MGTTGFCRDRRETAENSGAGLPQELCRDRRETAENSGCRMTQEFCRKGAGSPQVVLIVGSGKTVYNDN